MNLMVKRLHLLAVICRLILGCLFILASIDKILSPADFFRLVAAYGLLPYSLTGFVAGTLPWIECCVGILLVSGVAVRSSAFLAVLLLFVFLSAVSINYIRGNFIDCGCYTVLFRFFGLEERIGLLTIFRDLAIWLIAVVVFLFDRGHWGLGRSINRMIEKHRHSKLRPAVNRKT
jgi:uncharacterized membrane protein YphA (DoxX/SURF4 family)